MVRLTAILLLCALGIGGILTHAVPLPARLSEAPSTTVLFRDGSAAHVFVAPDGRVRVPVALERVDPRFVRALLALEDKRFGAHPGIDPLALARATWTNFRAGRRVSGASTLTMQLVRVLEPRPRTLFSKGVEALRAMQLETRLAKSDILAAYLQFAPYGKNVEGIESAALAYFGHSALHLSAAEIATLLAVPQAPARRFPRPQNAQGLRRGRADVARRLAVAGIFTAAEVAEVEATALPTGLHPFPRHAPHVAFDLRKRPTPRVETFLDPGLQRLAERTLHAQRDWAHNNGIYNAGILLVEHATGEVRAAVGNFDFWDAAHAGQMSSLSAPRSPGSALKPFLYAWAIEKGIANPAQRVPDLPIQFSDYSPHNFDGEFRGLVTLEEALSLSLNVPFVHLLREVGVEPFLNVLRRMGAHSLNRAPGHYGLSAAVGGVEITPTELASAYATLAQGGVYQPLRWTKAETPLKPVRIFSRGAAFLARQTLALRDRPDFPERRDQARDSPFISWKTGTSFGFRDAWAAGSTRTHTAVIWMGNLNARGANALTGASAAAPVLFDLLEAVEARHAQGLPSPEHPPADLTPVEVCAFSGHIPTPACPQRATTLALRRAVPTKPCPFHVRVEVDTETRRAVTPLCRHGRKTELLTFASWPTALRRFGKAEWLPLDAPPPLAEDCEPPHHANAKLAIVSPPEGKSALLMPGIAPENQRLPLEADSTSREQLSWFVDGRFLGTLPANETLWWTPALGHHEVVVTSADGRSARRPLDVALRPN
ncbi:MAG: penicillin-binding protein 1C [Myxococcaceae bacterium]